MTDPQHQRDRRRGRGALALLMAAALVGRFMASGEAAAAADVGAYVVNSAGDEADIAAGDRICRTALATCTLRAAMTESNRDGGPSTVTFAIPGPGTHTIQLASALPGLTDTSGGTFIDGYTQQGAVENSDPLVSNAVLTIQIRGTGVAGPEGFVMSSAGNTVRGIALFDVRQSVRMTGSAATGNVVSGSFLGTDATGTFQFTAFNSNGGGVVIRSAASRNLIGGPLRADRNVIAGNAARGVTIGIVPFDPGTNENRVENNIIGLTPNGVSRRANLGHGVDINAGASRNVIGGIGKGNLISGNNGEGIEVSHGTTTGGNEVIGNFVGTGPGGVGGAAHLRNTQVNIRVEDKTTDTLVANNIVGNNANGGIKIDAESARTRVEGNRVGEATDGTPLSNGTYGIQVELGATDTVIGPGNLVAHNTFGIRIMGEVTDRNTVTRNSMYDNASLGIDIEPLGGVNPNDAGDGDSGANDQLNFPVLTTATATSVSGSACPSCTVELFEADTQDVAAHGEGKIFLGSVQADPSGHFDLVVAGADHDRTVTSTATDTSGNTSEFSANAVLPRSPDLVADGFDRTVVDGWGEAEVGGPYTSGAGGGVLSVTGSAGNISLPAGGSQAVDLLDISATHVELVATVSTDRSPLLGDHTVAVVARRQDELTMYAGRLRITSDGSVFVAVLRGEDVLAEVPLAGTASPGDSWVIKTRVNGTNPTTIRAKAWLAGSAEPAGWAVAASDSTAALQGPGAVGISVGSSETAGLPVLVQFEDLSVRQVAPK